MNDDVLRDGMRELADDVRVVDLRPRVLRTSRRLAVRRAVTTTAAVTALMLGAAAVVNGATTGNAGPAPIVPGGPSGSSGFTGPNGSAGSPGTSPGMSEPDGTGNPYPGNTMSPKAQIGTLYFLEDGGTSQRQTLRVGSWAPGRTAVAVLRELPRGAWNNANVSPDGKRVSWVDGDAGALHVAELKAGGQEQIVANLTVDGLHLEPVWADDSKRLLVRTTSGTAGTVDVAKLTFTPLRQNLPAGARHAAYSTDGGSIAFATADGELFMAEADGSAQRKVDLSRAGLGNRRVLGVQSFSLEYVNENGVWQFLHAYAAAPNRAGGPRSLVSNMTMNINDGSTTVWDGGIGEFRDFQSTYRTHPGVGTGGQVYWKLSSPPEFILYGPNGEYFGNSKVPAALTGFRMLNAAY